MSSSKQVKRIEKAVDAVDWAGLSDLSDLEINKRWSDDSDTVWPEPNELAEFKLVDSQSPKKPSQAAE